MRKQKGFSLIELLIVVAIILIIAAIAIPNLLKSRMAANEASAVGSVRTINTAEVTYASTYPQTGYSAKLENLKAPATAAAADESAAGLLDSVLAADPATKSGYTFTYTAGTGTPVSSYTLTAVPVTTGTTGMRAFASDQSGVIRFNTKGTAPLASDPPLQ